MKIFDLFKKKPKVKSPDNKKKVALSYRIPKPLHESGKGDINVTPRRINAKLTPVPLKKKKLDMMKDRAI